MGVVTIVSLGCHNPETWDPSSGIPFTDKHMEELLTILDNSYIRGITFSGGDPLYPSNRYDIEQICKKIKQKFPNKNIWLYTGYNWEDIKDLELIKLIDVLVEGPFIKELADVKYPWAGSTNQKVIDVFESLQKNEIVLYGETRK